MFAFEIWGNFASFRDPFTISQNISLPIPPKTTIAGMMASVLGEENYLENSEFHNFKYSIIPLNPIRKKSFSQNYINDYTSKVKTHLNSLKKRDFAKISEGLRDKKYPQKPINRELLLNVKYMVFIKDFLYEDKIKEYLKNRISKFPLYLGNSEFSGNYNFIEIDNYELIDDEKLKIDSFVLEDDIKEIDFQENIRYTKLSFATQLNSNRTPIKSTSVIFANKPIYLKSAKNIYKIKFKDKIYYCRFI